MLSKACASHMTWCLFGAAQVRVWTQDAEKSLLIALTVAGKARTLNRCALHPCQVDMAAERPGLQAMRTSTRAGSLGVGLGWAGLGSLGAIWAHRLSSSAARHARIGPLPSIGLDMAPVSPDFHRPQDEPLEKAFARLRANIAPKPQSKGKRQGCKLPGCTDSCLAPSS